MTKINLKPLSAINRNMAIALLIATTAPVTTATAHTAMSTYAATVNAAADDEGNTGIITGVTSIKGIDDIIGLTYDEIKAIAVEKGTFDEEATGKIIFLWLQRLPNCAPPRSTRGMLTIIKSTPEAKAVTPTMARLSTMMAQYRATTPLMKVTGNVRVALSCCRTMP